MSRRIFVPLLLAFSLLSFIAVEIHTVVLQQQLDLFSEFYTLVDKNFVDSLDLPDLTNKTMNKMLGELDPYSHYYDVEQTKKHNEEWKGVLYAGIGSTVRQTDSGVVIVEPSTGMPAMREGLRTGDLILEINGHNVQHLVLDTVVHLLKGNAGDSIELKLKRPYTGMIAKKFARETILNKSVPLYFLRGDSVGYLLLAHFLAGSAKDFKSAVADLKARGMKKLIIDLRGNNGGLVDECASALSAFLPEKKVVCSLRMKDSTGNYSYYTSAPFLDTLLPLILLTDRHTISSGEIFAGCLKDYKRAILIGDRTYGKGFVQGTRFLKGGQTVYLTVARYYTPAGNFIGTKGVAPDIIFTKPDSLPPDLLAVISSGIICDYTVKLRNTGMAGKPTDLINYNNFIMYYQTRLADLVLPEEKEIKALENYPAAKELKAEIKIKKRRLAGIYRKDIEAELKKELLKRFYQYTEANQIKLENSELFKYLIKQGYIRANKPALD
jgi:C-terminal peptidase prc